jgi:hypothetical protein
MVDLVGLQASNQKVNNEQMRVDDILATFGGLEA